MPIQQRIFKRYLTFDGKRYEIHAIRHTKANANKIADSLRRRGFNARIVSFDALSGGEKPPFGIYARKA